MPPQPPEDSSSFEEASRRVEAELRRWVASFNDDVVPRLRRDGGKALRIAAAKLAEFADRLDQAHDDQN